MANNHSVCRLCLNEIEEQNISLFSDYQNIEYYYIIATALANITVIFFCCLLCLSFAFNLNFIQISDYKR